jgi:hypothetical protein
MTEKLHAIAVLAPDDYTNRRNRVNMMWLFVTRTRVVDAIDIPDRYLSGRYLTPALYKEGDAQPLIESASDAVFKYYESPDHISSVPREMVLFANVRMQSELNDEFKLADQSQWNGIVNAWQSFLTVTVWG